MWCAGAASDSVLFFADQQWIITPSEGVCRVSMSDSSIIQSNTDLVMNYTRVRSVKSQFVFETTDNQNERVNFSVGSTVMSAPGIVVPTVNLTVDFNVCLEAQQTVSFPPDEADAVTPQLTVSFAVPSNCSYEDVYNGCFSSPCSARGMSYCEPFLNEFKCICKPGMTSPLHRARFALTLTLRALNVPHRLLRRVVPDRHQ